MFSIMRHNKINSKSAKILRSNFAVSACAASLFLFGANALAETADWLASDLTTTLSEANLKAPGGTAYFNDDLIQATTVTQNIRILKKEATTDTLTHLVDTMIANNEIGAEDWLAKMPRTKPVITGKQHPT